MHIYTKVSVFMLFFVGGWLILSAQNSAYPLQNNTLEAMSQSDSVVEGTFLIKPSIQGVSGSLESPLRQAIQGMTFSVPFTIKQSIKGGASGTININLFYPTTPMPGLRCTVPIREKLLLFLKKNPNGKTFDLVNPWGGWLVIPQSIDDESGSPTPEVAIFKIARAFLKDHLANPQEAIQYPTALSANAPFEVINPDPNIIRALQMGRDLAPADPDFISLLKQYSADSGQVGHVARTMLLMSGNIQDSLQRLADHDNPTKASGDHNLEVEIEDGLRLSSNLSTMQPLIVKALASPDAQIRLCTLRGLAWNQTTKDKSLYPVLVSLLDDPDREVQHATMACIFSMSGEIKHDFGKREIEVPAVKIFEQNPDPWIHMYKSWWEKNKNTLQ